MATLMAEERRLARQRKILQNSEKRMNMILAGDDGKKRSEPGLEDGPVRSLPFKSTESSVAASSDQQNKENGSSVPTITTDDMMTGTDTKSSSTASSNNNHKFEYPDMRRLRVRTWNDTANANHKPYERPRIVIAAVIGVLSALLVLVVGVDVNVFVPWCVYETIMECLFYYVHYHVNNAPPYPSHRHIVNVMLWLGVNEKITKVAGRIEEMLCRMMDDTATMLVVFFGMLALINGNRRQLAADPN